MSVAAARAISKRSAIGPYLVPHLTPEGILAAVDMNNERTAKRIFDDRGPNVPSRRAAPASIGPEWRYALASLALRNLAVLESTCAALGGVEA